MSYGFGSCQYDDDYKRVLQNAHIVLDIPNNEEGLERIKHILSLNYDNEIIIDSETFNESLGEKIIPLIKKSLFEMKIEWLSDDLIIECSDEIVKISGLECLTIDEKIIKLINFLEKIDIEDIEDDIKNEIESLILIQNLSKIEEAVDYLRDSGWDLWGASNLFAGMSGLNINASFDEVTSENILFLIWKYKIQDWEETFTGFST